MKKKVRHENTGACLKCTEIFNRYPGFYPRLRHWFENLQLEVPTAHISCAGRNEQDQEALFLRKSTRAHYGQSAHNYNAAIDIFELADNPDNIYEHSWFKKNIKPNLKEWMVWYGDPTAPFWELPHIQVRMWKQLVKDKKLKIIS